MLRIELGYLITTCIKDECDKKHAEMLLKSIMIMINETWINEKLSRRIHREEYP
jgi:hypothetical protein